ncbi:MAG: hypothetical protein O3A78_04920 [Nitrospinae bacterium]|nr:hypothetical protein [Nitrospinota bacterium]MDA1109145.1 hypothetical protein [Nitrospinota bacterium]
MNSNTSFKLKLLLGLIVLMVLTRYIHFRPLGLPSATLAIFFIAGIYLREYIFPALLIGCAGLIDYFSVQREPAWCITSAYGFLIPTYLALWFGGRRFQTLEITQWNQAASMAITLAICTTLAFVISNGSFYALSGHEVYESMNFMEYAQRQISRFPGYLMKPFLYVSIGSALLYKGWLEQFIKSSSARTSLDISK